ncbi:hypothetical protein Agub_g10140 [Astrephomene gubernaculifera]|uniref:Pentatricopeptide repeat-containing protein n=1 Tax=Astrephomene gubernaculifera TaxID=47775 RepID=A0AAD3HNT8_9CHLO|nr:hypothetical protein Agub_g10140 [Astrephomene gubernaculifera]
MNACPLFLNWPSRHGGGILSSALLPLNKTDVAAPTRVHPKNPKSIVSLVLSAYVPRGATHNPPHSNALKAACVAAAISQRTIHEQLQATGLPGRTNAFLNAQDKARALLLGIKNGSTSVGDGPLCNLVIRALCSSGERWSNVWLLYNELWQARIPIDLLSYRVLYDAAIESHHYLDVVELLRHSQQQYGTPPLQLFCALISRLAASSKRGGRGTPALQAAYTIWRMLRASKLELDAVAYRAGMNLCVDLGRLGEAQHLLQAMRTAGHRPGWGAYHILMKYHVSRGDMDAARRLFRQLREYHGGKPPGISAYNVLLAGYVRQGDLTCARAMLDKARREGVPPDDFTYSCLVGGLASAGRLEEAEALLGELQEEGRRPEGRVYGALLNGCVRANDWPRVERLLARMRMQGVQPSREHYNMLIRGRCYCSPAVGAPVSAPDSATGGGGAMVGEGGEGTEGGGEAVASGAERGEGGGAAAVPGAGEGAAAAAAGGTRAGLGLGARSQGGEGRGGAVPGRVSGSGGKGGEGSTPGSLGANLGGSDGNCLVSPDDVSSGGGGNAASAVSTGGLPSGGNTGGSTVDDDGGAEIPFAGSSRNPSTGGSSSSNNLVLNEGPVHRNNLSRGGSSSGDIISSSNGAGSDISSFSSASGISSGSGIALGWVGGHVDALLSEMRAAGLRPDIVTYGTLMHAAVRWSSIEAALQVLAAMRVDGVAPDGAIYTALMKLFRAQGRQAQAVEFFQQLASSRTAVPDIWALNCLAAVHASGGDMAEAEAIVRQANRLAADQGRPPPPEATYALLQGYGRRRELRPALLAFRRFLAAGGRPHRKMCEFAYRLCLSQFEFEAAGQVLRAMRLMRFLQLREGMYRRVWEEAQQRFQARRSSSSVSSMGFRSVSSRSSSSSNGSVGNRSSSSRSGNTVSNSSNNGGGGGGGSEDVNLAAEKWKWWFGLPNKYYQSEWK